MRKPVCLTYYCNNTYDSAVSVHVFPARQTPRAVTITAAMPRDESIMTRSQTGAGPIDWPAELERHGRWLRTVALARVGDAAAADDVMQEVATAALEKGH